MTTRTHSSAFVVSLLGIFVLATPVDAQRGGDRGGNSRGGSSQGGSGGGSRGGGGGGGGGSSQSSPQRSSPAPQRSSPPPSSHTSPSPRSQPAPSPAPRSTPSRVDSTPRYSPPAPVTQPPVRTTPDSGSRGNTERSGSSAGRASEAPRYVQPETYPRVYDSSLSRSRDEATRRDDYGGRAESGTRGSLGARDDVAHKDSAGFIDLSGARPRRGDVIPRLSSSDSAEARRGPGAGRVAAFEGRPLVGGIASRSVDASRSDVPGIASRDLTREKLLERYGKRIEASAGAASSRGSVADKPDLSRARGAVNEARTLDRAKPTTSKTPSSGRTSNASGDGSGAGARGKPDAANDYAERIRHARLEALQHKDPSTARKVHDAGTALARVNAVTSARAASIGLGAGSDCYDGWFQDPSNDCNDDGSWNGHGGYGSGWYWGCNTGWYPAYGWHNGWGFSFYWGFSSLSWWWWNHCAYYPNYSSWWCGAPVTYTTVIYDDYDPPAQPIVVYVDNDPPYVSQGEGVVQVAQPPVAEAASAGARPKSAPAVQATMKAAAVEYRDKGDEAFREGRYSDAAHHYARSIEYEPENPVNYLVLADALFATGDYHYAAFALGKAVEYDANIFDKLVDKHAFYADPAEFDKQLVFAEEYLNDHFLDDDARLVLAANYLYANRMAQALDLLSSSFSAPVRESKAGAALLDRATKAIDERKSEKN